jgi:flagellar motor switch protein FliG
MAEEGAGSTAQEGPARKSGIDASLKGFIKETSRDAGYRKAAKLLMLLGREQAARVLKHLSPAEVEGIAREIARTQKINESEASKILEEFGYIRETRELIAGGGVARAEEMLVASVGREKADLILAKVKKDMAPPPFSFLMDVDIHQAISLLREESPPVLALILSHLDAKVAARILSSFPPEVQRQVVPRIARMSRVDGEVISRAEETLREKLRTAGKVESQEMNGRAALTEILRSMDPKRQKEIVEGLEPNVANLIRKALFTVDVVFQIPDKHLQAALRDYADREIALLLEAVQAGPRERILAGISERRRESVRFEREAAGDVSRREAEAALEDFLGYLQLLEQKGEIAILREREQFV